MPAPPVMVHCGGVCGQEWLSEGFDIPLAAWNCRLGVVPNRRYEWLHA